MKTPRFIRIISVSSVFLSTFLLLASTKDSANFAYKTRATRALTATPGYNFDGEQTNPSDLTARITSASKTDLEYSFSFTFSTGGEGFSDSTGLYTVAPQDASFESYYLDFQDLEEEDKEEFDREIAAGTYVTPEFDASIAYFTGKLNAKEDAQGSKKATIYIPRYITRNNYFNLNVLSIWPKAIESEDDWSKIKAIHIPNTVSTIYSNSFVNVPADMVFNVEFTKNQIPDTWDADWAHGAIVNYGVTGKTLFPKVANEKALVYGSGKEYGPADVNYIIGYYPKTGTQIPMVLEYKVNKNDAYFETRYIEFAIKNEKSNYNSVGKEISGYSTSLTCDIRVNDGEVVDLDSLVLHNIYNAVKGGSGGFVPDDSNHYSIVPDKMFSHIYELSDYFDIEFDKVSSFGDYLSVGFSFKSLKTEVYNKLKPNYYKKYKNSLNNGTVNLRQRITSLGRASYNVKYEIDGVLHDTTFRVTTPIEQFVIDDGISCSFIVKRSEISTDSAFKVSNIKEFSLKNFYISSELRTNSALVAGSKVDIRFAALPIVIGSSNVEEFNTIALLIILAIIYIVGFVGVSVALFFIYKNKYKNDEFRRLKPAQFIKKAILGLLGSLVVLLFVYFLALRISVFSNVIIVYNPIDAFIILFGLFGAIILGYFIFYLYKTIKTAKERRNIIKLNINNDGDDDGTK